MLEVFEVAAEHALLTGGKYTPAWARRPELHILHVLLHERLHETLGSSPESLEHLAHHKLDAITVGRRSDG